jgi:tetratricopeptide (TPR) repeat protein
MESADTPSPRGLELGLSIFVAIFAFLLASFPARNSDVWMHLAAGRHVAHGEYSFGSDSRLTPDLRTGQNWLYDLLCYGVYSIVGPAGLVVVKALMVAGLAVVIWRLSRLRGGTWLAAIGTILALVAMGPRLQLQPTTVSYLLFGLALWMMFRKEDDTAGPPQSLPCWGLLALFLVWANMDSTFLLGLATVALIGLGRFMAHASRGTLFSSFARTTVLLLLLAAVCLMNPSHIHGFAPPSEWLRFTPPWSSAVLLPHRVVYFSLLLLGLISFGLNWRRWLWQRFLPWLGLGALSVWQVSMVPFFALAAGPVLAWNCQEFLTAQGADGIGRMLPLWARRLSVGLAGFLGLALLICVWPGWLGVPPYQPRRWAIETAPSLQRGAEAVRAWHQEGRLEPDARALHLSHDTAHAFAWFCPEEKGILDERLASAILGTAEAPEDWAEQMRAAQIDHVIIYDTDPARLLRALGELLDDPRQWPLLYLEGDLAVFGWRDPARAGGTDPFREWELDLNRLAFHPTPDKKAPPQRPDREPKARRWWDDFWKPAPPPPIDRNEAKLYLLRAEALRQSAPWRHMAAWQTVQSAAIIAAGSGWTAPTGLFDAYERLRLLPLLPEGFARQRDDTPPALLYLALRAARRAVGANPDDAEAYRLLGECYLHLFRSTRERAWAQRMPQIAQLRFAQASVALNRAVALKPNLAQAHLDLALLYKEIDYFDLAVQHGHAHAKLVREAGPPPGVSAVQFREERARAEEELSRWDKSLEQQQKALAAESAGARVLDRATAAFRRGLAGNALDILLESDVAAFGPQGMALELDLLLMSGRVSDVRDWTSAEQVASLGEASYHWLRARALAALGDYVGAKEEYALTAASGRQPDELPPRQRMASMIGQLVLDEVAGEGTAIDLIRRSIMRPVFLERVEDLAAALRREAEATVLRGLIALEEGEVGEAEIAFRTSLLLWQNEAAVASGSGLDFKARIVAQGYLELLK